MRGPRGGFQPGSQGHAFSRALAGQGMVERRAERINVGAGVRAVDAAPVLLQRGVAGRARQGCRRGSGRRVDLGNPEIHQVGAIVFVDDDIFRLHIAVDHRRALAVQVIERGANLVGPGEQLGFGDRPIFQHLCQVAPRNKIHHHELRVAFHKIGADARQVGMV